MENEELKPCPFCGAKAKPRKSKALRDHHVVKCRSGHSDGFIYTDKDAAVAAWNARA